MLLHTTAVFAVLAAQPAFAAVDFFIGDMVWGTIGGGAQRNTALIYGPIDSYPCDELDGRLLQNPAGSLGAGNFKCEGCSGGGPKDWDITKVELNAKRLDVDSDTVTIREGDDGWIIEDGESSEKIGDCTPIDGVEESCTVTLDNYTIYRFMRCDGISSDK